MKKLLLATLAACGVWLGAQAQNTTHDYTDDLVVSVDNFSTPPMPTTVSIEFPEEGLINIELKNFTLKMEGADPIPVGNIHVSEVPVTPQGDYNVFDLKQKTATFSDGDPGTLWMWSFLFPDGLPIDISGKISDTKLYCTLDLTFGTQIIHVTFGKDDFESSIHSTWAGKQTETTNVYTLQGMRVKSNVAKAHALDGLQKGIYIVDGKKVIKE